MYSQNLSHPDNEIKLPPNYDGVLFSDEAETSDTCTNPLTSAKSEVKVSPKESENGEPVFKKNEEPGRRLFPALDLGKGIGDIFAGLFRGGRIFPEKLELEDLLIIGIAAFLFFSPSGDKECALILLALIFVN